MGVTICGEKDMWKKGYFYDLWGEFQNISPVSATGVFFIATYLLTIVFLFVFGHVDEFYWNLLRADFLSLVGMASTELFTGFRLFRNANGGLRKGVTVAKKNVGVKKAQFVILRYNALIALTSFAEKADVKIDDWLSKIKSEVNSLSPLRALGAFLLVSYMFAFLFLQIFGYTDTRYWNVLRADFFALAALVGTELFTDFRFFRNFSGVVWGSTLNLRTFVTDTKPMVKESVTVLKAGLEESTNAVKQTYPLLKETIKETPSLALDTVKKVSDETLDTIKKVGDEALEGIKWVGGEAKGYAGDLKGDAVYFKKVDSKRIKYLINPRRHQIDSVLENIKQSVRE